MSLNLRDIPHTYIEADKLLTSGKDKLSIRNIGSYRRYYRDDPRTGPQGYLIRCTNMISLKLYDTVICRYYKDDRIWINAGRYPTRTTMNWINQVLRRGYVSREKLDEYEYRLVYYGEGNKYGKVLPYMIRPQNQK